MKAFFNGLAIVSLVLLTVPAFLFLAGKMRLPTVKVLMLAATLLWFACRLPKFWCDKAERN